jgi:formate dehydrogenase subunit gamma
MARFLRKTPSTAGQVRRRRAMKWSFILILAGAVALPMYGYLLAGVEAAQAVTKQDANPRANFWRAVREGTEGVTTESGPYTTNALIQNGGQNWRELRNGPVSTFAPWVLAVILLAIGTYHILVGPSRLRENRSGKTVERWTMQERVLHWYVAALFIILAISGLSLLFGRAVLIPLFGLKGFSVYADFAKILHNYLGPFFVVGVLLEIVAWIRFNLPTAADVEWMRSAGGMFNKSVHPHAGRFNAGEKAWFWVISTVGIAVCITGLIMDFPNFNQSREAMQVSNIVHAALATIWIAVSFGHMYLGTVGVEGALEGMTTGRVSVEWAKQHHDLWYDELHARGGAETEGGSASGREGRTPRGSPG